ncbi:MAG: dihydrofolate reductase family protein [Hyphomonadaceae bacterium]
MRPVRYSINITLDGCYDHTVGIADAELHKYAAGHFERNDAAIFGRVVYQMMEEAWRPAAEGNPADWIEDWMLPFARAIAATKKYVVSSTLKHVDWNAELLRGDLGGAVRALKAMPGKGILVSGVQIPQALAGIGLIDEYEFIVHPRIAGRGPTLFVGLPNLLDLKLIGRQEFASGAVVLQYEPRR